VFGKDYHIGHFAVHFAEVMSYDVIFMSKEEKKSTTV
jgi:hypothetical protein